MGNLTVEKDFKNTVQYTYNELNQLTSKRDAEGTTNYTYDKRGNRTRSKLANWLYNRCYDFVYDETNHLVRGTPSSTVTSEYTWNGLGVRVNNTQTSQNSATLDRDYVIDYTSAERNDLAVYAEGFYKKPLNNSALYDGQIYDQKNIYAGATRVELFYHEHLDKNGNEGKNLLLYTHEDIMGSTVRYSAVNPSYSYDDSYYDASFYKEFNYEEHVYDSWGGVQTSNGYLNDPRTTVVEPNYTGHAYDSVLQIYFADARFYDAANRQWMSSDPVKSGLNWYQYCYGNPTTYYDPDGEIPTVVVGVAVGAVVGGVGTYVENVIIRGQTWEESKANILANTAAGALAGGLIGSGAGLAIGLHATAVGNIAFAGRVGAGAVYSYQTGGSVMNGAVGGALAAAGGGGSLILQFGMAGAGSIATEYGNSTLISNKDELLPLQTVVHGGIAGALAVIPGISKLSDLPKGFYSQGVDIFTGKISQVAGQAAGKFEAGISIFAGAGMEWGNNLIGDIAGKGSDVIMDSLEKVASYNEPLAAC